MTLQGYVEDERRIQIFVTEALLKQANLFRLNRLQY